MARTLELDTITEPSNSGTANITLSSNTTTTMPLVDINGGAIDATTLGAGTPSSVAATTLTSSGNATFGDAATDATTVTGTLTVTRAAALNDNVTIGTSNLDTITVVGATTINAGSGTSYSGGVVVGATNGNQTINIASHDEVDGGLGLAGVLVTASAAELNVLDGGALAPSMTLAATDRIVVNDAGTMKQVLLSDLEAFMESALDTTANITTVGVLVAGSLGTNFGNISIGSSTITTTGALAAGTTTVGALVCTTIDTGNGATEIYDMNQDLRSDDTVTFASVTTTGTISLGGKLTAGSNEIEGSNFDINGGTIDGVTSFNGTEIVTSATNNLGIGVDALNTIGTGDYNVAFGDRALYGLGTGISNTAIGYNSAQNTTEGDENTVVGYQALNTNISGDGNVAVGSLSLHLCSTGGLNTALGISALYNTTGSNNTAIGKSAGDNITSGSSNIMIGADVDADSATGSNQLNIGGAIKGNLSTNAVTLPGTLTASALNSTIIGVGSGNAAVAEFSSIYFDGASGDVYVGLTGNGNTLDFISGSSVEMNLDTGGVLDIGSTNRGGIKINHGTGDLYHEGIVFVDKSSNNNWDFFSNHSTYNYGIQLNGQGNNAIQINEVYSGSNTQMFRIEYDGSIYTADTTIHSTSDRRLKENIVDANSQWDDIKALQFKNFNWRDKNRGDKKLLGLIADEVEPISPGLVGRDAQRKEDIEAGIPDPEYKTVIYSIVWMKAVKALQEAMVKIETLEAKVKALEAA